MSEVWYGKANQQVCWFRAFPCSLKAPIKWFLNRVLAGCGLFKKAFLGYFLFFLLLPLKQCCSGFTCISGITSSVCAADSLTAGSLLGSHRALDVQLSHFNSLSVCVLPAGPLVLGV